MRCNGYSPEHTHVTVEETRRCWRRHYNPAPVAVPPPPPAIRRRNWRDDPISNKQLDKITNLGGDAVYAVKLTKGEASDYIDRLIRASRTEPVVTESALEPTPSVHSRVEDPRLKMVKGMIDMVPEGNYAVTYGTGEKRHVEFIRITRPTAGQYRGSLHIQSRHADTLKTRIVAQANGTGWWDFRVGSWRYLDALMEVIQDYKTCALRYSVEAHACSHCATPLTDDRSRHYLVGPICEKKHGYVWPVIFADDANGMTFEELQARGLPYSQHHDKFLRAS